MVTVMVVVMVCKRGRGDGGRAIVVVVEELVCESKCESKWE